MAGNPVTCNNCGRVFVPTAERSVYDQPSHSYICSRCLARDGAQGTAPVRGKKPRSKVGSVLRIVFGLLFIATAFDSFAEGEDIWSTCLIIGLALLIWQFWPRLKALSAKRQTEAAEQKQAELRLAQEEKKKKVCPYCGAPTTGLTCEYCGMTIEGK